MFKYSKWIIIKWFLIQVMMDWKIAQKKINFFSTFFRQAVVISFNRFYTKSDIYFLLQTKDTLGSLKTHAHTHTHTHARAHIRMHTHSYRHIQTNIHIHTHTHTYTYTLVHTLHTPTHTYKRHKYLRKCAICHSYHRKKWTWRAGLKSWMRLMCVSLWTNTLPFLILSCEFFCNQRRRIKSLITNQLYSACTDRWGGLW